MGLRIFIGTRQDVDGLAARAKEPGLALETDVHETPWGRRAFELADRPGSS